MKHFENVVRKLYPNPDGIILNNSWLAGDTTTIEFSGLVQQEQPDSIQVPHSFSEGCFITWIQNDHDSVVEQTSKTKFQTPLSTPFIPVLNASIYPIPAKEMLHISGENLYTYKLINLSGEVLKQDVFKTNNPSISLSEIPTGIYILELVYAHHYHRFEKIIVNK